MSYISLRSSRIAGSRITGSAASRLPLVGLLLGLLISLGGCQTKPSATVTGVGLTGLDLQKVKLTFDVKVENPYKVALPLVNIGYRLASQDRQFLNGQAALSGSVPAEGARTIQLPVELRFSELLSVLQGVRPGAVVPYSAGLDLSLNVPVVGAMTLPLNHSGRFPIPTVPSVALAGVKFGSLSFDQASVTLQVKVKNTNDFDFTLGRFQSAVKLSGQEIGQTSITPSTGFTPGQEKVIELNAGFSPKAFGLAFFNTLFSAKASYNITGTMGLSTSFGNLDLPYNQSGEASLFR